MSRYEVLVIGAGIVGAACAYRLAERGLKVGVLEQAAAPAMGSTGKSAAGVRVQFTEATNILLSWHSIQEYCQMPQAAYRPTGYLFLVPGSQWEGHMAGVEMQRRLGAPVEVRGLEAPTTDADPEKQASGYVGGSAPRNERLEAAQEWFDFSPAAEGLEPIRGATYGPADGIVDPHGICMEYLGRARQLGAVLHTGTEFLAAERVRGGWQVQTSRGLFQAQFVLNAAGAWAGEVGRRAGLLIPVQPARRMVFCTAPTPHLPGHPLTIDLSSGFWFRPEHDRLIFGRSNPADLGFREGMDWAWLEPTLEVGLARFPWLGALKLDRRASWWGYYEVTPDHNPILGRMPGVEGWVNACGFSGHGVQQAAMVGRLMAEEVVYGRAHSLNPDSLRLERFSQTRGVAEKNIV
ncbi:FAD-dependent oxidoreductase [uncultured Meiothermus sp.]|jgi:sarcosine oxidase subunit beta|uniref:NAD(P)/FAD-dependent oxidoreductase n=1 Tax=uncultured Meiothermus sp. TaxID=157471 RepID=UPI00262CEFBF|nr:FAD-dependent oxidoreductase [uncultured Meiothermus sp.]